MKRLVARLLRSNEGQDLIEYGLLVGIITIGAIAFITTVGGKVADYFDDSQHHDAIATHGALSRSKERTA